MTAALYLGALLLLLQAGFALHAALSPEHERPYRVIAGTMLALTIVSASAVLRAATSAHL